MSEDGVSVLAEIVELADEIDVPRAREALERTKDSDDEADKAAARRRDRRGCSAAAKTSRELVMACGLAWGLPGHVADGEVRDPGEDEQQV